MGVAADGAAHGARRRTSSRLLFDATRDPAVRGQLAVRDLGEQRPHTLLERGAARVHGRKRAGVVACEVAFEPCARLDEYRQIGTILGSFERRFKVLLPLKPQPDDRLTVAGDGDRTTGESIVAR